MGFTFNWPKGELFPDMDAVSEAVYYEGTMKSARSRQELYTHWWLPKKCEHKPRAVVVWYHGYNVHSNTCKELVLADLFTQMGIGFFTYDHQGHGRNGGMRLMIEKQYDLVDDAEQFAEEIHSKYPQTPIFISGESMGGAIAAHVSKRVYHGSNESLKNMYQGSMLHAPALDIPDSPTGMVKAALLFLADRFPSLQLGPPTNDPTYCWDPKRCPTALNRFFRDRENGVSHTGRCRLGIGRAVLMCGEDFMNELDKVSFPFLVLHGTEDYIVNETGSARLYAEAPSNDKTYKKYKDVWHDLIMDEIERPNIVADIREWVSKRLPKA